MSSRVLVTHPLVEGGLELLQQHYEVLQGEGLAGEALSRAVGEVDALVPLLSVRIDRALLEQAPRLKVVANYAVGVDNIDLEAARQRGLWVTNTPDVLTEATADLAWAGLLAVVRRVVQGDALVRRGEFTGWGPTLLLGMELRGKVLGVVGMGKIGRAVARRAVGFGMQVLYYNRGATDEVELGGAVARGVELDELLIQADVVSLHTPLTAETHHLIDRRRLQLMRPGAYLVNTARGPVVDEAALLERLQRGELAGAALDVYEAEPRLTPGLEQLDSAVLLPHLGSATRETRLAMARLAARNVHAVLQGEEPPTPVVRPGPTR